MNHFPPLIDSSPHYPKWRTPAELFEYCVTYCTRFSATADTCYNLYQVLIAQFNELRQIGFSIYHSAIHFY